MNLRLENERFVIIMDKGDQLSYCEDTFIAALNLHTPFEVWVKPFGSEAPILPVAKVMRALKGQHFIVDTTNGPKRFIYQAYKDMMDYCATA